MLKVAGLISFLPFALSVYSGISPDSEILKYSTYIEISNNKIQQTDSIIIRINNRSGEEHAEVSISYNKDNPVSGLSAWITDRNGAIVRHLKSKEITDANTVSSSFYTDYYTKKFTLKHNEYPYSIVYTYQTSARQFMTVANWYPVIDLDVPTQQATLMVKYPENYRVRILQNNINPPEVLSSSGLISQKWYTSYDGSVTKETFSPDPRGYVPAVKIIPVDFQYGISGSMESWQSFGTWQTNLINGLDELPESEKATITNKILNIKEKREIVRILYYYLQDHTRYIDVYIGIGGMKPYPASYVAQNKYGDCKALSIYMKALLNFAGIKSHYLLVNAGQSPGEFYKDTPFQQFNHAMLVVPVDNDTIWLENTSNCLPFGYLGTFTQNRPALLVDGSNSRLVRLPALLPGDVATSCKMEFVINDDGGSEVAAQFIFRGRTFETYNGILTNYNHDDQNQIVHNNLPFPVFDLNNWKIVKADRNATSLTLEASVTLNRLINRIGDQFYFSLQPAGIPDFESPSVRKLPVYIPYPINYTDTISYHLPSGKKFVEVPPDKVIESKYGKYILKFRNNTQSLSVIREYQLNPASIPHVDYSGFYEFISSIKSQEKIKILFQ